ncbi:tRNA dihydrouridine(20/20a) synthase DusA [Pontibacter sp. JAM-7]|uniref:tRNA dihydrouridine(20/20a) synthase DusA n=1 Tax=Pontibacter sp. JAM-7 TaxID=3366581 RepID=UPI003AF53410
MQPVIDHNTVITPTTVQTGFSRRFCVAPMMDWTDRHCRYFHRLLTKHALLYTEMVTTGALLHAEPARFLQFNPEEQPVALQLGGSNPADLAKCAVMAEQYGYSEVNLNVGCPSDRVQNNMIGACLMAHPQIVADALHTMQSAVSIPVTVKHRLGIDNMDSYEQLFAFVDTVRQSGCNVFIIHARKAILDGLSPKENREIPPLKYDWVYQIKQAFPELEIIINGGIKSLDESLAHLSHVDGVMLGREAYHNPFILADVDQALFNADNAKPERDQVARAMLPYIKQQMAQGTPFYHIVRHMLGLFHAQPGGKKFRRFISEHGHHKQATPDTLLDALACISRRI